jgi:hypothetical protein
MLPKPTEPFGHHPVKMPGMMIDSWGRGPLLIRDGARSWWFEFSDRFGPQILSARWPHNPIARQPATEAHPFWAPFERWMKAGKKHRAIRHQRGPKKGLVKYWLCWAPR